MTRRIWLMLAMMGAALLGLGAGPAKRTALSAKVYKSANGIRVTIVRLAPASARQALILITGADSEVDGKIVLHDVDEQADKVDFRVKGGHYVTVAARGGRYEVYVPGKPDDGVSITYDDKLSDAAKADDVVRDFERQPHP